MGVALRETAPGFFHARDPPPRAALDAQQGENQMTKDFEQRLHMLEGESPKDRGKPDDAS